LGFTATSWPSSYAELRAEAAQKALERPTAIPKAEAEED